MSANPQDPPPRQPLDDGLALVGWMLLIVARGGALSAFFGPDAWYAALRKPAFNPPSWVFAPVWTALYVLMAAALWLVRREHTAPPALRRRATAWFALQFALNLLWTPLFFGLRSPLLAVIDILLLIAAVVFTILAFRRVRPLAGWLLLPYLAWLGFAAAVNIAIWLLNRAPHSGVS
jgi:tryptophan-rich sensory protein